MKLVRFGERGAERPGAIDADGRLRDLSALTDDFEGAALSLEALARLRAFDLDAAPLVGAENVRFGAPLASTPNIFCIGLNYAAHAREAGKESPSEPIVFSKATSALAGPFDPLAIPEGSEKTDWEVELGVVIGAHAHRVSEADALGVVAGYCVVNDVSERFDQLERGGQWMKGKSHPGFAPVGPVLATADDVADPQALSLWFELNGARVQSSATSDMIFSVAEIVSYLSRFVALQPGDLIATGTPEGVGMGATPPRYLRPGDRIRAGVDGLGAQEADIVAAGGVKT